jgi:rubrerythrin
MTPDIDFKKLSLCDAVDLAILVEEEARERYGELAEQLATHHNQEVARFFQRMVQVETSHESVLTSRRRTLFRDQPRKVTREMIFDVEAPAYDDARADMSVRQALEMARTAETKARDFFVRALAVIRDPEVSDFFLQLRDEEVEHLHLVEAQLAKLPPDPAFAADAMADEPVGH